MFKDLTLGVLGVLVLTSNPLEAQITTDAGSAVTLLLYGPSGQGIASNGPVQAFVDMLANATTSFPIATSSGAFSYVLDRVGGTFLRRTDSFGPVFAERPLTNGRTHLNVGLIYQRTKFDTFAGEALNSLRALTPRKTESDLTGTVSYESSIELVMDRTTISAIYGLADRVDVGLVVPFGRTIVTGSSIKTLTSADGIVHTLKARETVDGSSTGLADMIVRTKVALLSSSAIDLAADVDVRLPTGSPSKLLGLGVVQTKAMIIGSRSMRKASGHFNIGYTWSGSDDSPRLYDEPPTAVTRRRVPIHAFDEFSYTAGTDIVAAPTVTLMADVIGRTMTGIDTVDFVMDGDRTEFVTKTNNTLNQLLGTFGAKVQIGTRYVISMSVLFPLNGAGIKPRVTPVVGVERNF